MAEKKTYHVKGMHCHACEVIMERKLRKVSGVTSVKVDRAKETVTINTERKVPVKKLSDAILPHGYHLYPEDHKNITTEHHVPLKKRITEIGVILVIVLGLWMLLQQFNLIPSVGISENMGYGVVLLIGIIAGTSSCMAVSGGILLGLSETFNRNHPHWNGWQKFKPHLFFNAGRIVSYAVLGGAIGLLGSAISLSSTSTGILTIIVSLFMILIGLQLLHIFPWLNKFQIKPPKFIAHKLYDASASNTTSGKIKIYTSAFLFGGATFFLPCGFTQALQLYVLAQASPELGFWTMLIFSLGTLPALLFVGLMTSFAKGAVQRYFSTFAAILILVLGIFSIQSGLALAGIQLQSNHNDYVAVPVINGVQIVKMQIRDLDYSPARFEIKKDIPVQWEIDASQATGCAQVIIAPKLGINEYLGGSKVITFTPTQTGLYPFSCPMGMTTKGAQFKVI